VRHHHRQPCRECGASPPAGNPTSQPRPNCTHRDQPPRRT
jgi:hypothetical protein